jgi:hypothetical protein
VLLTEAVAAAVREAAGRAVQEAVRGVLAELPANPDLLDRLRAALGLAAPTAPATPAVPTPPTACAARVAQARAWVGAGWHQVRGACATVAGAAARAVAAVQERWRRTRQCRVPLLTAAAVGAATGVAVYCGGPTIAGLAGWIAGFTTTLAVQAALWLRPTFSGPPPVADACPGAAS